MTTTININKPASQISTMHHDVLQAVTSVPSVFSSKTARKHYLQRRKQATKPKAIHRKAWEFFGMKDYDD